MTMLFAKPVYRVLEFGGVSLVVGFGKNFTPFEVPWYLECEGRVFQHSRLFTYDDPEHPEKHLATKDREDVGVYVRMSNEKERDG